MLLSCGSLTRDIYSLWGSYYKLVGLSNGIMIDQSLSKRKLKGRLNVIMGQFKTVQKKKKKQKALAHTIIVNLELVRKILNNSLISLGMVSPLIPHKITSILSCCTYNKTLNPRIFLSIKDRDHYFFFIFLGC